MKYLEVLIQKISPSFSQKSGYLALLVASLLSYGLLIPRLGFYMDDWPYVYYAFNKGIPSLEEMLLYDSRPNAAWLYIFGFQLLGFKPIAWHIASLLMHWGTAVLLWMVIRAIWQNRKSEAIQVSLLFAVYPFFMLQPFAVGSTHHWFGFLMLNLSLLLMIRAVSEDKYKTIYLLISLGFEAVHLFTSEYFSGLELIRPVIIWILIARTEFVLSKRIIRFFLHWLPYIIVLCTFAYWRIAIYENPAEIERNNPVLVYQLWNEPVKTMGQLLSIAIKDVFAVLTIGWNKAMDVDVLDISSPFTRFKLAVSVLSFTLAYFYLSKLTTHPVENNKDWKTGSITLAIVGLMSGGLPIWLIGRSIVESRNLLSASRFGIPITFGAAFLVSLLIDILITEKNKKLIVISMLLALAVNFHLSNTHQFQYSWEKQVRFSQELIWRAPQLKPGTALFTDEEVLGMMGNYAVSFSINTTYQPGNITTPPYWYFPFYYTYPDMNDLLQGTELEYTKLSMEFSGDSKNMLLLSFNPEENKCLWVLSPRDVNLRLVSSDMRTLSAGSNLSRIEQAVGAEPVPPEIIYGKTNTQTWCYFFEKADLARQYKEWEKITNLLEQAQSLSLHPNNGYEMIPFIEGYAHLEDWKTVKFLVRSADKITASLEPTLCPLLDELKDQAPASADRDTTINDLKGHLRCDKFQ